MVRVLVRERFKIEIWRGCGCGCGSQICGSAGAGARAVHRFCCSTGADAGADAGAVENFEPHVWVWFRIIIKHIIFNWNC